ncbi:MAG TPA: M28 family peptidase [Kofleriaceae bacterium]|nr:M28 family peptidase [Kofleriaceae bacterium]
MSPSPSPDDVKYAYAVVDEICARVGPGMPGTLQEHQRADVIRRELERHLGGDHVVTEPFSVAPWAWLSAYPICAVLIALAAAANLLAGYLGSVLVASIGLAFAVAAPVLFVAELVLGHEVLDRLFTRRPSENVVGTLPATGAPARVLIVSAHHDSAPENTWFATLGYAAFALAVLALLGFAFALTFSAVQVGGFLAGSARAVAAGTLRPWLVAVVFVPGVVYGLAFNRGRAGGGTVPGAADDLSGCGVTLALCRFLVAHPEVVPAGTEIRFVSFGSEEAGLRGSRAYVARHRDELRRLDAHVLDLEMIAHPTVGILRSDLNGTVIHAPASVAAAVEAARRARVPYEVRSAYLGVGTDAAPFSQAGIAATTLMPFDVPKQLVELYHQPSDRPEHLDPQALANTLAVATEWVRARGD